jgi:DNA adenine methylase
MDKINAQLMGSGLKAPFGRTGGKNKLKKRIVDGYFPDDYENMIYVEPFLGAGSIYFYKNPSKKEVINDLDETIYNLIKGFQKYDATKIKNDVDGEYNKKEFEKIKQWNPSNEYGNFIRNLILARMSFLSNGISFKGDRKINSNFEGYKERLKNTIILNKDYKEVIKKYDSPDTFFYLDPPYEHSEKLYKNDTVPIVELYNLLSKIKGHFLISYNDSKEAKQLFKDYYIKYVYTTYENTRYTEKKRKREMLIADYPI